MYIELKEPTNSAMQLFAFSAKLLMYLKAPNTANLQQLCKFQEITQKNHAIFIFKNT